MAVDTQPPVDAPARAPRPGLIVGLLVLAALVRPRWRVALAIGAPVARALAGLYVFVQQTRHNYPRQCSNGQRSSTRVHMLGWFGVALLAADALVETVRTRRRRGSY